MGQEAVKEFFNKFPDIALWVGIGMLCIIAWRCYKAEEIEFLGFSIKGNSDYKKLKRAFDELDTDSKQKSQVLVLLRQTGSDLANLTRLKFQNPANFKIQVDRLYAFMLQGIATVILKNKDDRHRVAFFVPEVGSNDLKIHKGSGYSSGGLEFLRLSIEGSWAGRAYRTRKPFISGDVTKESDYEPKPGGKNIMSLACVPVSINGNSIGVLSIDSYKCDAFSEDDKAFLENFAAMLGIVWEIEQYNCIDCMIGEVNGNEAIQQKEA